MAKHEDVRNLLKLIYARKDAQGKMEVLEHLTGQSIASCLVEEFRLDKEKGMRLIDTFFFGLPTKTEATVMVFEVFECINHDIRYVDDSARWFFQPMIENKLRTLEDQLMDIGEGDRVDLSEELLRDLLLILRRPSFSDIICEDAFKFNVHCLYEFEVKDSDSKSKKSMYLLLLEVLYRLPKKESTEKSFEDFMFLNITVMASLCPLFLDGENRWVLGLGFDYRSELAWYVVSMASRIDDDVDPHPLMIDRRDILGSSRMELESAAVDDLRKAIGVQFVDEMGTGDGVSRDWFTKLAKEIVESHEKAFDTCESDPTMIYPRKGSGMDGYFRFCGRFFGLAIIHRVQVGYAFGNVLFMQLCGQDVMLEDIDVMLEGIEQIDPSKYNIFKELLKMNALQVEQQGIYFEEDVDSKGAQVTKATVEKYIRHHIDSNFVTGINSAVTNLMEGLDDVLTCLGRKYFFDIVTREDFTLLLKGIQDLDLKRWKESMNYEGYNKDDDQIVWFWNWLGTLPAADQERFLSFWISTTWLPVRGYDAIDPPPVIRKKLLTREEELCCCLPSVQTCASALDLPPYPTEEMLCQKLELALLNHRITSGSFFRA